MKLLCVHADLDTRGGAESLAGDVMEAARELGHEISVLDIAGCRCNGHEASLGSLAELVRRLPVFNRMGLLKYAIVCRAVPSFAASFDAVIYTYAEGPPVPGSHVIQFLHAPAVFSSDPDILRYLIPSTAFGPTRLLRQMYSAVCQMIADFDTQRLDRNAVLVANSEWTARTAGEHFDRDDIKVLYPKFKPVVPSHKAIRDPLKIVALGRIVANKNLDQAISIIEGLRERNHPASLTVIGHSGTNYAKRLKQRHGRKPFITFVENAPRDTIRDHLARASFGLHCYRYEHFGIAVAEMCSAGCIPMVFDGGGTIELIPQSQCRFSDTADAVQKIIYLMENPTVRDDVASALNQSQAYREAADFDSKCRELLLSLIGRNKADDASR